MHTELFVDQKLNDVAMDVIEYFDEPFGDSSAIPTHMISREARKHVKVILTGDGGDELFAGYTSYLNQKYQLSGRISSRIFKEANRLSIIATGKDLQASLYPRKSWRRAFEHWLWVRTFFTEEEIRSLITLPRGFIPGFFRSNQWLHLQSVDSLSVSYAHDINYYLPDDLLKKVDMASMLTSLECRAPFLDHRLIEFSLKIPPHLKVKNDVPKYILKTALKDMLPAEVLHRPKTGFGAPIETWIRRQLREAVRDMLMPGCRIESIIPREGIACVMNDVYGVGQCTDFRTPYKLWLLFVLEVWMRRYC